MEKNLRPGAHTLNMGGLPLTLPTDLETTNPELCGSAYIIILADAGG